MFKYLQEKEAWPKKRYLISLLKDKSLNPVESSLILPNDNLNYTMWQSHAHIVEVLDTLNGNTNVYLSIREAAASIGVVESTIRNALKNQKEKGVLKLIKKRYQVKQISK